MEYLSKIKRNRAEYEAWKRSLNRVLALARYDPNLSQESREEITEIFKQGIQMIDEAQKRLEKGG